MKPLLLIAVAVTLTAAGCAVMLSKPTVEVEAVNRTSRQVKDAAVHFGDYTCAWGYLSPSASASYLFYPHPITLDATVTWEEEGGVRSEKLSLRSVYPERASGRLTITIRDDGVAATFQKK